MNNNLFIQNVNLNSNNINNNKESERDRRLRLRKEERMKKLKQQNNCLVNTDNENNFIQKYFFYFL